MQTAADMFLLMELWKRAEPGVSSPAEAYLRRRGIQWPAGALIRWLPYTGQEMGIGGHGAMVVAATAPDGSFRGVQLTAVGRHGERLLDSRGRTWRRSHGALRGAAAWLVPGGRPVIAEGTETALAALELATRAALLAMPEPDESASEAEWSAWAQWHHDNAPSGAVATLGTAGMANLELPLQWHGQPIREVFVATDGDDAGRRAAAKLSERLLAAGVRVMRLEPAGGGDFADLTGGGRN